jgi:hypothetical protein
VVPIFLLIFARWAFGWVMRLVLADLFSQGKPVVEVFYEEVLFVVVLSEAVAVLFPDDRVELTICPFVAFQDGFLGEGQASAFTNCWFQLGRDCSFR